MLSKILHIAAPGLAYGRQPGPRERSVLISTSDLSAVHGAFVGDLQQTCPLRRIEGSEFDRPLDSVNLVFGSQAHSAQSTLDLSVSQSDGRPSRAIFVAGVKAQRHRH